MIGSKRHYLKELVKKYCYTFTNSGCHAAVTEERERERKKEKWEKSRSLCTDIEWSQGRLSRKMSVEGKCGCHCLVNNRDKERRYTHICSHIYRISLDKKQEKLLTRVGTYKRM